MPVKPPDQAESSPEHEGAAQSAGPAAVVDLTLDSVNTFADGHGALADLPDSVLAEDENAFASRDPFSADYADLIGETADDRQAARVDEQLRADLLERPHLFTKPEENAHRGGAAVWRSLRDQLHGETLARLDGSERSELLALKRELETRRIIVEAVATGIGELIARLEQRLEGMDQPPPAADPHDER